MKKLLLLPIILMLSVTLHAQKEKTDLQAVINGFFNGLSLLNADTLKYYATSDFELLEDGEVWNMDTLINKAFSRKDLKIIRVNKFGFITTEQKGNSAWVSYWNTAEFTLGDRSRVVKWLESAVLVKEKGKWKIRMLHSTAIKP